MGENKKNVFNGGCPRIDLVNFCLKKDLKILTNLFLMENRVEKKFDLKKDFNLNALPSHY